MAGVTTWFRDRFGKLVRPSATEPQFRTPPPPPPRAPERPVARHDDAFALDLYHRLRQPGANLVVSPFSVRAALAMACAGARGETEAQMRSVLRLSGSGDEGHAAIARVLRILADAGGARSPVAVACSLWGQEGAKLLPEYLDVLRRHYDGEAHLADFRNAADAARAAVNRWAGEKTRGSIPEILPPGSLTADTRLVLATAAYLKAQWLEPFDAGQTRDAPFFREGGGEVLVPMMSRRMPVSHARGDDWHAVDLPFRGCDLVMRVFLPDARDGLAAVESKITERMLHGDDTRTDRGATDVVLPRFRVSGAARDLEAPLRELGMPLAFTPGKADFSGINGPAPPHRESLHVSSAFHRALVQVDEEGAVAAAAATVGFVTIGTPAREVTILPFRADHPFVFAIRERRSGAVLFLGRVADPSAGG